MAQKAIDMMCERALSRETAGSKLADKQFVQGYIADSYAQLIQFRLFVLYTAWEIDKYNDYKRVRKDIATAKVVMPTVLHDIAWRAMQVHGALGTTNEMPFFGMIHGAGVHGPGRRPHRGAQGHGGPPGAARLQGERRHLAHAVAAQAAGGRRGEVRQVPGAGGGEPVSATEETAFEAEAPTIADVDKLTAWLDTQGLGVGAPLEHGYISGGSQNEIYELRRGDLHCAMRIPPPSAPASRDDGIVREWRIIEALDGTDVPHTEAIAVCTDQSVLGRTFYLMGFVDGWSPMSTRRQWPAPFDTDLEERRGLAFQLVEGIALLGNVDWQAKGLADLGRPDGFHERQVDRWTAFLERIKGRELPGFDEAAAWLRAHRPIDYIPGLMHGDYQFANVMFKHGAPARLAAIVDWEMGTVGDPKLDLGWVVQSWPDDTSADEDREGGYVDMTGMPLKDEVLAHYATTSGRQVDDIDYYCVLAKWKLAVVLEQGYQRAGDDEKLQAFGPIVTELMQAAAELAETTDYSVLAD